MSLDLAAYIALALAAIPAALFATNLFFYRRLPASEKFAGSISVLIPARNEEANIAATLDSVLANDGCEFEVIVLDDDSTDRTGEIVAAIAERDARVRLEKAPRLPAGWCGKQHACFELARLARGQTLVFLDADVRLASDALPRMAAFLNRSGAALTSGVPRQELQSFSERLLIPLIHFLLLGFLPMFAMRWSRRPAFSAGCGQLFVARRDAYFACGGHSMIRESLHDGIKLPRVFRKAGFGTDLFDATDVATCRMYRSDGEVWRGLAKNATEGLGAPRAIAPMSVLLFGGHVLPWLLLLMPWSVSGSGVAAAATAALASIATRLMAATRFRQPISDIAMHPMAIVALLWIQWAAALKQACGRPAEWKGRAYLAQRISIVSLACGLASAGELPKKIELEDQFGARHTLDLSGQRVVVLTVADRKGLAQVDAWVVRLKEQFGKKIALHGIADISGAPEFLRDRIRAKIQQSIKRPVLLDWSGTICKQLETKSGVANLLVIANGKIKRQVAGEVTTNSWEQIKNAIE